MTAPEVFKTIGARFSDVSPKKKISFRVQPFSISRAMTKEGDWLTQSITSCIIMMLDDDG